MGGSPASAPWGVSSPYSNLGEIQSNSLPEVPYLASGGSLVSLNLYSELISWENVFFSLDNKIGFKEVRTPYLKTLFQILLGT